MLAWILRELFCRPSANAAHRVFNGRARAGWRRHEGLERREVLAPVAGAPAPAAATAAQNFQPFIDKTYQDFLGRAPDPSGQASWSQFLTQIAPTIGTAAAETDMVNSVMSSPEYRRDVVTNIYENFLHRAPDPAGLQFWMNQLGQAGESVVLSDILGSPEYASLHGGTTAGVVSGLYNDVLGRAPDAAGQAFWTNQFGSAAAGSSASANLGLYNNAVAAQIDQFLNSQEGRLLLLNNSQGTSGFARLTGQGWNQLFFQGNLTQLQQNAFFANLQSNPSFEMELQQLLGEAGYYQGTIASAGGTTGNGTTPAGAVGDVPPAGFPLPANP